MGTGKGYGTTEGLRAYLRDAPDLRFLVRTALRKNQLHDQQGLALIPLDGRINRTCRKVDEARVLGEKGYNVRQTLCQRRCPFVGRCVYLQQFGQEGDFFATLGLLRASGWWHDAGVLVLDEFAISHLLWPVQLDLQNIAALGRSTKDHHTHAILRWLGSLVGSTADRALVGTMLLNALDEAAAEGLNFRVGCCPAAEAESADGIFSRRARGLKNAIEADEFGNDELAHRLLQMRLGERSRMGKVCGSCDQPANP